LRVTDELSYHIYTTSINRTEHGIPVTFAFYKGYADRAQHRTHKITKISFCNIF